MVYCRSRGRSSAVERQLPKLNVAGSIPVARYAAEYLSAHRRAALLAANDGNAPPRRSLKLRLVIGVGPAGVLLGIVENSEIGEIDGSIKEIDGID